MLNLHWFFVPFISSYHFLSMTILIETIENNTIFVVFVFYHRHHHHKCKHHCHQRWWFTTYNQYNMTIPYHTKPYHKYGHRTVVFVRYICNICKPQAVTLLESLSTGTNNISVIRRQFDNVTIFYAHQLFESLPHFSFQNRRRLYRRWLKHQRSFHATLPRLCLGTKWVGMVMVMVMVRFLMVSVWWLFEGVDE